MRFTIETEPFIRMLDEVSQKTAKGNNGNMVRLIACRGRLYVEGHATVAETEVEIGEEGQCKVSVEKLGRLLKASSGEPSITLQGNTAWLRCGLSSIPISGYSAYAVPPARFHVYLANDTGVVPSKFLLNSLAQEL